MTNETHTFIEKLYLENYEILYYYANTIVNDPEVSENLVNDTFLDALRKAEQLTEHEKPIGWLMQALKLNIRNYRSKQAKQPKTVSLSEVEPFLSTDTMSEENFDLSACASLLSEDDYRMLTLFYIDGYSHNQLAQAFGISVSASQKRLERIKQRLRKKIR